MLHSEAGVGKCDILGDIHNVYYTSKYKVKGETCTSREEVAAVLSYRADPCPVPVSYYRAQDLEAQVL